MEDPDTLIAYAKIFEQPRRYVKGGTLHPPGAIELAAARALRWYAKCIVTWGLKVDKKLLDKNREKS